MKKINMKSILISMALLGVMFPGFAQEVSFTISADAGCAPFEVTFTNTSNRDDIGHIEWNMGDESPIITDVAVVNYTFFDAGFYFITMTAYTEDWEYIEFYDGAVEVEGIEEMGASPEMACPGEEISFFASEGATSYTWDFGDNTTGSGLEVSKTYNQTGTYTVTLTATFESCGSQTKSFDMLVDVGNGPEVEMQFDAEGVCPGESITFLTPTVGSSYLWDFGDGNTSSEEIAYHAYQQAGSYNVTLSVTNGCGGTGQATSIVNLSQKASWPDDLRASVNNPVICPNQEVRFTADEGNYTYKFDFGDGKNVIQTENAFANFTYAEEGDYYAEVTFFNACQADTSIVVIVNVTSEYSFIDDLFVDAEKDSICPASYNSYFAPPGYAWYVWDYGDGSKKDSVNANEGVHFYEIEGTYETNLKIYNSCGADTVITSEVLVTVNAEEIEEDISIIHPSTACPNGQVDFYVSNDFDSYQWNFGDGSDMILSESNNIEHVFTLAGEYNVSLIVSNSCGNTKEVTSNILIDENQQLPEGLQLIASLDQTCPGSEIILFAPSGYAAYVWMLNGNVIDSTLNSSISTLTQNLGTSNYGVKIYNSCGKSANYSKSIEVSDNLPFTDRIILSGVGSACPGQEIVLFVNDNFATYEWNFGDNTTFSGQAYSSHKFSEEGVFEVSLTVTNSCGSDSTVTKTIEVRSDAPFDDFVSLTASKSSSCPGEVVSFFSSSNFERYVWLFGENDQVLETGVSDIAYTYQNAGIYDVQLTLYNSCGNDTTLTISHEVSTQSEFPDDLIVVATPQGVCPEEEVVFTAPSGYLNYQWDFGDEDATALSNLSIATHTYASLGDYNVRVSFENLCGAIETLTYQMKIRSDAPFDSNLALEVDTDQNCPGDEFIFTAPAGYSNYEWDFGVEVDTDLYRFKDEVAFAYSMTGTYLVNVTFQNNCGNTKTLSKNISVGESISQVQGIFLDFTDEVCPENEIIFQTKSGFSKYVWEFGDGTKDTTSVAIISHAFPELGSYNISLTVFNSCGASVSVVDAVMITDKIEIFEEVEILTEDQYCPGEPFLLQGPLGFDRYDWTIEGFTTSTTEPIFEHEIRNVGTYNVALTIYNSCGSDSTFTSDINIGTDGRAIDPFASLVASAFELCAGDEVGFTLQAEGINTYLWSIAGQEAFVSGDEIFTSFETEGEYIVAVTASNFCGQDTTISASVLVSNSSKSEGRVFELDFASGQVCPSEAAIISATRGFKTYQWSFGDGQTVTTELETISHAFDFAGNYLVNVIAYDNCQNTYRESIVIEVSGNQNFDDEIQLQISSSVVCLNEEVYLSVLGAKDSYSYTWSIGDSTFSTKSGQINYPITSIGIQPISVIVTNLCGNTIVLEDALTGSSDAAITDVNFGIDGDENRAGCPGDAITFFFEGEYINEWDFGDGNTMIASNVGRGPDGAKRTIIKYAYEEAGTYEVKLSITNGCGFSSEQIMAVTVGANISGVISVSLSDKDAEVGYARCNPIIFTANSGVSFDWSFGDGTSEKTSNPSVAHAFDVAGEYQVFVNVTNGCGLVQRETISVQIADQNPPTVEIKKIENPLCFGSSDGSIEIKTTGFGPFSYSWNVPSDQRTSSTITDLKAGYYGVTVTDRFGCSTIEGIELLDPAVPEITGEVIMAECGQASGAINLSMENSSEYSFIWNDGVISEDRSNLKAGDYSVLVTSNLGCSFQKSFSISEISAPEFSAIITDLNCADENNGSIFLNIDGVYQSILWSTGSKNNFIQNQAPGEYSVVVTSTNGCISSASFILTAPDPIEAFIVKKDAICGVNKGEAEVIAAGGSGEISYLWSNGHTGNKIKNLSGGQYSVIVSDANGCEKTVDFKIEESVLLEISATVDDVSCFEQEDGAIMLNVQNGIIPYSYKWSTGQTTSFLENLVPGDYEVYVSDAAGCGVTKAFNISQPEDLPAINLGVDSELCESESLSFEVSSAYDSVIWSTGSNEFTVSIDKDDFDTSSLDLWVLGFNEQGCSKADTVNLSLTSCVPELSVSAINVEIYPNPLMNWTQLDFQIDAPRIIGIYSVDGRLVTGNIQTSEKSVKLNLEFLENGIYFIQVEHGNQTAIHKIIKQ